MAEQKYLNVNPEVLKWARESIALNKKRAADLLAITVSALDRLESGGRQPTLEELKTISKKYQCTIATLLLYHPPAEKPLPKDCRTVDSSIIGVFDEKTIINIRKARSFTQSLVELYNELAIPIPEFTGHASQNDDAPELGLHYRKLLAIDEIKVDNDELFLEICINKLEHLGIAVFQLPLNQDGLRGFSLPEEPLPTIVIKSGQEKPSSKVFTLFHEFGHILLREGGLCDITLVQGEKSIEQWCNAFAAELLVPLRVFELEELVGTYERMNRTAWKDADIKFLSEKYHVGNLVVLRRLLALNRITADYYRERHNIYNKPSFGRSKDNQGRNIPKEKVREKGRNYTSMVFRAFDTNRIDIKDVADYLGVNKLSYIPATRQLLNTWA